MPFQPGQSGNPGGRTKERPFRDALRLEEASALRGEECVAPKGSLRWNARQLLERGEPIAIREIADRLDGKVPQAIVGDDEHDPIAVASSETSDLDLARRIAFLLAKGAAAQSE